ARWTNLSSSAVTPSGRCRPSALVIYTLRTGLARYAPRLSLSASSWRVSSSRSPQCRPVSPSTPAAASLLRLRVGHAKRLEVVDVVQERREPHLPVPACCLPYPLQRTGRALPAQSPGRVLLLQVPFGQTSSLHLLRHRLPGVVR